MIQRKSRRLFGAEALEPRMLLSASQIPIRMQETLSSNLSAITDFNGAAYFVSTSSAETGSPLYRTDGTATGTTVVATLPPGVFVQTDAVAGGVLYLGASTSSSHMQLWRSDGTAAGTTLVEDFGATGFAMQGLLQFNGELYFSTGGALWKSDGTASGTVTVTNAVTSVADLTVSNGVLYFTGNDRVHGFQLWKTDGSSTGTAMVTDINPGSGGFSPTLLTDVNGTLFFTANDGIHGQELWKSDGTASGTVMVDDIDPGGTSSSPYGLTNVDGTLYFAAYDPGSVGLYKSDGTASGTERVTTINSNPTAPQSRLAGVNDRICFTSSDGLNTTLMSSDGTAAGTAVVAGDWVSSLVRDGNELYFVGDDPVHGQELWSTDGTAAGTGLVADIYPGPMGSNLQQLTAVGGSVYFTANDGVHGQELWTSDGTAAGTILVDDLNTTPDNPGYTPLAEFDHKLLYNDPAGLWALPDGTDTPQRLLGVSAGDPVQIGSTLYLVGGGGYGTLWETDGTPGGTVLLHQFAQVSDNPRYLFAFDGSIFLSGRDPSDSDYRLWTSDGTVAGTAPFETATGANLYDPQSFAQVGDTLYFYAYDSLGPAGHGYEPWKTDGTAAGTAMVKDIAPGPQSSAINNAPITQLADVGGVVVFPAAPAANDEELYRSDGTDAGTYPITNFAATPGAGVQLQQRGANSLVVINDEGFFMVHDAAGNQSLWKTDGTMSGTMEVAPIDPGDAYPLLTMNAVGNQLFLIDLHGGTHNEYDLWRSDGTSEGTQLLRKFMVDSSDGAPGIWGITDFEGIAYFSAWSVGDGTGDELWASNGTAQGTMLAADVLPGPVGSGPAFLTPTPAGLIFSAAIEPGTLDLFSYTPPPPPTAPLDLHAVGREGQVIQLTWTADAGASTYNVYRGTTPGGEGATPIAIGLTGDEFTDNSVDSSTVYYYRITASNPSAESPASSEASAQAAVLDVVSGTAASDNVTLKMDPDGIHDQWSVGTFTGLMLASDPNGLTINGNGGNDTITLDYTNGNPLPNNLHLNGTFTINGLQGTNPLAGTSLDIGKSTVYVSCANAAANPIAAIKGYLQSGYNGGAWNGTATVSTGVITSAAAEANANHNTAIGFADWADGQGVNTMPNTIELKYTLYGDANLDGQVNSADLQRLLFGLNRPGAWDQGDFNYAAQVNSADLQELLFTLNTSLGNQVAAAVNAGATAARSHKGSHLMRSRRY